MIIINKISCLFSVQRQEHVCLFHGPKRQEYHDYRTGPSSALINMRFRVAVTVGLANVISGFNLYTRCPFARTKEVCHPQDAPSREYDSYISSCLLVELVEKGESEVQDARSGKKWYRSKGDRLHQECCSL